MTKNAECCCCNPMSTHTTRGCPVHDHSDSHAPTRRSGIAAELDRLRDEALPPLREETGFRYDPDVGECPDTDAMWTYIEKLEATYVATLYAGRALGMRP